jgi:hypothetical protein
MMKDKEIRELATRKGMSAEKQRCPGTWVLWKQVSEPDLDPMGDSAETVVQYLETLPDDQSWADFTAMMKAAEAQSSAARDKQLARARGTDAVTHDKQTNPYRGES